MKIKVASFIALIITITGITTGASHGQSKRATTVIASVPFEFLMGNRLFPSGTYVFEMATGAPKLTDQAGVLIVRNRELGIYAAVATGVAEDEDKHSAPKLAFTRNGERVYLSKVWYQGSTAGFSIPLPQGASEVEESESLTLDGTLAGGI